MSGVVHQIIILRFCFYFILLLPFCANADSVYKYKDESGRWVFSDKNSKANISVEKLEFKQAKVQQSLQLSVERGLDGYDLIAHNPYYAPIELRVHSSENNKFLYGGVLPSASTTKILKSVAKVPPHRFWWVLGDPAAREEETKYKTPIISNFDHKITQSFNGRFSHSKRANIYAVDIAMKIGTTIRAARGGIVIWVKDDYHMGGKRNYFLDKANMVKILHEDGTYAIYAHILEGTAVVKPGDVVKAGTAIARSGSSGYSTGPHLHFVIRKNTGLKTVSLPFVFEDDAGRSFTPKRGDYIRGARGDLL